MAITTWTNTDAATASFSRVGIASNVASPTPLLWDEEGGVWDATSSVWDGADASGGWTKVLTAFEPTWTAGDNGDIGVWSELYTAGDPSWS